MEQILSELISAIFQVISFSIFPVIFFLLRKDKSISFFEFIGITTPPPRAIVYVIAVSILFVATGIGLVFINDGWKQAVLSPNSVTGKIRLMGLSYSSAMVILIVAWIKTSLSEEIFFRGFLAKQLINKIGFTKGNILQSIIFGLVHLLLFGLLTKITMLPLIVIFIFSSFAGWLIGYVKEKYARGSIIPGWIAHGLGNTISYAIIAYCL